MGLFFKLFWAWSSHVYYTLKWWSRTLCPCRELEKAPEFIPFVAVYEIQGILWIFYSLVCQKENSQKTKTIWKFSPGLENLTNKNQPWQSGNKCFVIAVALSASVSRRCGVFFSERTQQSLYTIYAEPKLFSLEGSPGGKKKLESLIKSIIYCT